MYDDQLDILFLPRKTEKVINNKQAFNLNTGIHQYTLLMWGHKKTMWKQKPHKLK